MLSPPSQPYFYFVLLLFIEYSIWKNENGHRSTKGFDFVQSSDRFIVDCNRRNNYHDYTDNVYNEGEKKSIFIKEKHRYKPVKKTKCNKMQSASASSHVVEHRWHAPRIRKLMQREPRDVPSSFTKGRRKSASVIFHVFVNLRSSQLRLLRPITLVAYPSPKNSVFRNKKYMGSFSTTTIQI